MTGVRVAVVADDPATPADEADVSFSGSLTDIAGAGGTDYNPNPGGHDMTFRTRLRITDMANCAGSSCGGPYNKAATGTELDFPAPISCADTSDPAIGATCTLSTSADAVIAGAVKKGNGAVMQAFRVRIDDAGANGVPDDSDDRIFATQGIFVP
jgi:hypothetical protein